MNYAARILTRISEVSEADWDALAGSHNPFLSWRFLNALEESGCAVEETGWAPRHIWLQDEHDNPVGAAPLYAKTHSQGEYVFDHGWANAFERAGGNYYPKLQCAVPFTPVGGPRLLATDDEGKTAIISAMAQATQEWGYSSTHLTFIEPDDKAVCEAADLLMRQDRQFHFMNRNYESFTHFLDSVASRKRKNIRKERANAQDGVVIKRLTGEALKPEHWDTFYTCYMDTGLRKWGRPYLNRGFFARIHETMKDDILLVMAWQDEKPFAAALNFIGRDALYGRNWGALGHKPFLHFELCYYQAIDAAIELGLSRVEAGAQGEHKLARGYEPIATHSAHYVAHPGFRAALVDYLTEEREAVDRNIEILGRYTPFKKG